MSPRKNYSKISTKKNTKKEDTELITTENEELDIENVETESLAESTEKSKEIIGFVDGCENLYVRKDSSKKSDHLAIIRKMTEVVIDSENSTKDFYKVKTSDGIEGYCMKKFITIK